MSAQANVSPRILVTGGGGYLGSVLVPLLLNAGYRVHVLDAFYFGEESLKAVRGNPALEVTCEDILHQENLPDLFHDVDSVVHLASLSNDPSCDLDPNLSIRTNFLATMALARRAKLEGVKRFVFMSSCSVYGASGTDLLAENSATGPVTLYALSKLEAEHALARLLSDEFQIVILRLATLFGLSPRMRFDLAVNSMTKRVLQGKNILVNGSGDQYRPFLHVRDAAETIIHVLKSDPALTNGQVFNVGNDSLNYTIAGLASELQAIFPGVAIESIPENSDIRSYKVDFRKIRDRLGFIPQTSVAAGADEISQAHRAKILEDMDEDRYYNVLVMKSHQGANILPPSLASAPRWKSVMDQPPLRSS